MGVRINLSERSSELLNDVERLDEIFSEGLNKFGGPFLADAAFSAADAFSPLSHLG